MKRMLLMAAMAFTTVFGYAAQGADDGTGAICPGFDWDEFEELEVASLAVQHMGLGWNLGNTLESNSGDIKNMWIELWSNRTPKDYETAWGEPVTTQALIHMMKEAGFNAIRVPVTWYPHMGKVTVVTQNDGAGNSIGVWDPATWTGTTVDAAWMARVHEVVDYVINEGLYCILNVHHDTGDGTTAWIHADKSKFAAQKARYESLWQQIATEFAGYDERLLFEGYNEMLDSDGSWCYASFATPNNYNASKAADAYEGLNNYAQSFVNAVRRTGGNNLSRNLIINTYAASCGGANWNTHLQDPLKNLVIPEDTLSNHIIVEVHSYPSFTSLTEAKMAVDAIFSDLTTYLAPKAPVIIGEWGKGHNSISYATHPQLMCDFAQYFCYHAKMKGYAPFYWMGLSDGADRSTPSMSEPLLVEAMVKGFGGDLTGMEIAGEKVCRNPRKHMVGSQLIIEVNGRRYNAAGLEF